MINIDYFEYGSHFVAFITAHPNLFGWAVILLLYYDPDIIFIFIFELF